MAEKEKTVLITKDGTRHDGRKKGDIRNIEFKIGVLDRADGSALIEWGRNKILVAVYGPRELHPKHMAMPDKALIRCEYRMSTFSVPDRKSPAPRRREKEISKILGEALVPAVFNYLYPRSVIDVYINILQADGGSRCASVCAASLALADAGVPMKDLVVGVAAGNLNGTVVIDLDDVEDKEGEGDLPIAVLPNMEEVVLLQSDGTFTPKQYKEALDLMMPACKKIYDLQREALTNKYSRITKEVNESLEVEKAKAKKEDKPKAEKAKKDDKSAAKADSKKDKKAEADKKKKPSKKNDKKDDSKKSSQKKDEKK
ncbi:MAG: exosome complex exonuclease Rrp41 [Candidatus Heimdallarchaeota archaeon]